MVGQRFNVERTAAGQQFVIPGTEKPRAAPRIKYAREGSQLVIPGAEQGAVAELVGIECGVVSGVFNLELSGIEVPDWRPRHGKHYHEA